MQPNAEVHKVKEGNAPMSEKNQHWGSTLDDFLREEGIYEAAKTEAVNRTKQNQALADLVADAQKLDMGY